MREVKAMPAERGFVPPGGGQTINSNTGRRRALTTALILFLAVVLTVPVVLSLTYAGRPDKPGHTITYTTGKLTWDSATGIGADGSAKLNLFGSEYDGTVIAENGDKLIAPGADGINIIRLKNSAAKKISYTAVLYEIENKGGLPITGTLEGTGFADTGKYILPAGAAGAKILKSVTGSVEGGQLQDFDVLWRWIYEESTPQDVADTGFGDKAAYAEANRYAMGFYIVVEEGDPVPTDPTPTDPPSGTDTPSEGDTPSGTGSDSEGRDGSADTKIIRPSLPKTGDDGFGPYALLLFASAAVMCVVIFAGKARKHERN